MEKPAYILSADISDINSIRFNKLEIETAKSRLRAQDFGDGRLYVVEKERVKPADDINLLRISLTGAGLALENKTRMFCDYFGAPKICEDYMGVDGILVDNGLAYIASEMGTFGIWNLSNNSVIGRLDIENGDFRVKEMKMAKRGNIIYIVGVRHLLVIDVSNPAKLGFTDSMIFPKKLLDFDAG